MSHELSQLAHGDAPAIEQDPKDMRDRIKNIALELLTRDGYRGLRFNDIANHLNITRANIHYHFGKKEHLVEVVLTEYIEDTLVRYGGILMGSGSYSSKIHSIIEFHRERYKRFNGGMVGSKSWSIIARLRLEHELLTPQSSYMLARYAKEIYQYATFAVTAAMKSGEISADAPAHDLILHVASFIISGVAITQDAGTFGRLEDLYHAHLRIVEGAYGCSAAKTEKRED
jgi:TetR/AcrR family transcriptional repressor of nem operon